MSNKTAFESHSDGARRRKFPEQARTASRGDPANLGVNDGREAAAIARRKKIHGGFMSLIQLTAPPVTLGVGLEVSVLLASAVGWPLSSSTAASLCVAARIACSTFYLATGALHFLEKPFYLAIMPGWVPMHDEVIALTGVAELLAGFLMIRETNANFGAWLALLIVVAVYPANITLACSQHARVRAGGGEEVPWLITLAALPTQFLLLWWTSQYTTMDWMDTLAALPIVGSWAA